MQDLLCARASVLKAATETLLDPMRRRSFDQSEMLEIQQIDLPGGCWDPGNRDLLRAWRGGAGRGGMEGSSSTGTLAGPEYENIDLTAIQRATEGDGGGEVRGVTRSHRSGGTSTCLFACVCVCRGGRQQTRREATEELGVT